MVPARGKSRAKWSAGRVAGTRHPSGAAKFRFGNNDTPQHGNERSYNGLRLAIIADRVQEPRP